MNERASERASCRTYVEELGVHEVLGDREASHDHVLFKILEECCLHLERLGLRGKLGLLLQTR